MIIITPYRGMLGDKNIENKHQYLLQTILSVDKQKVQNLYHIIVDDGSTDGFCDKLKLTFKTDNRIWLRREKGKDEILTCTNATNFGVEYVLKKGNKFKDSDSITFLHSDDLAIDLRVRDNVFNSKSLDFLYTDALIFFNDKANGFRWKGLPFNYNNLSENIWVMGRMPYHTMTWRIGFLKKIKEFNKHEYGRDSLLDPKVGCGEDVDIALTTIDLAKKIGAKVEYLPTITYGYRIHNSSLAATRNQGQRKKEENSVLYKHFGFIKTFILHVSRFIKRPNIYLDILMKIANKNKKQVPLKKYIKYNIHEYDKYLLSN